MEKQVWEWLCRIEDEKVEELAKEYGCQADVGEIDNHIEDKQAFAIEYCII